MSTATDMLALYLEAEKEILQYGRTTRIGDRLLTSADLPEIRSGRKEWENRVSAEQRKPGPSLPHSLADLTTRS